MMKNGVNGVKTGRLISLIFSLAYAVTVLVTTNFGGGASVLLSSLLALAAPVSLAAYILSGEREFKGKSLLLPIGFGLRAVTVFFVGWSSAALTVYDGINGTLIYLFFALQAVSIVLMAVGTLFDFEYRKLLKWGAVGFIGVAILGELAGALLNYTAVDYGINVSVLIEFASLILFHIGIIVFATEKRS